MVKKKSVKAKKLPKIPPNPLPEGITSNAGKERKKKKAKEVGEKTSQPWTPFAAFYKQQADEAKLKKQENVNSEIPKETVTIGKAQIGWEKLTEEQREPYKAIAKAVRADRKAKRAIPKNPTLVSRISCDPVVKIIQKLSPSQREEVKSMGLGGLLGLQSMEVSRVLCTWLVERYDASNRSLKVHGADLKITAAHVERILGISGVGRVITKGRGGHLDDLKKTCFGAAHCGTVSLKQLEEDLNLMATVGDGGDVFRMKFGLFVIGHILLPTSSVTVSLEYLNCLNDCQNGSVNWASYVWQFLVRGMLKFKAKEQTNMPGCILNLMIFYFHYVTPSNELEDDDLGASDPVILDWTDERVKRRLKWWDGIRHDKDDNLGVPPFVSIDMHGLECDGKTRVGREIMSLERRHVVLEAEVRKLQNMVEGQTGLIHSLINLVKSGGGSYTEKNEDVQTTGDFGGIRGVEKYNEGKKASQAAETVEQMVGKNVNVGDVVVEEKEGEAVKVVDAVESVEQMVVNNVNVGDVDVEEKENENEAVKVVNAVVKEIGNIINAEEVSGEGENNNGVEMASEGEGAENGQKIVENDLRNGNVEEEEKEKEEAKVDDVVEQVAAKGDTVEKVTEKGEQMGALNELVYRRRVMLLEGVRMGRWNPEKPNLSLRTKKQLLEEKKMAAERLRKGKGPASPLKGNEREMVPKTLPQKRKGASLLEKSKKVVKFDVPRDAADQKALSYIMDETKDHSEVLVIIGDHHASRHSLLTMKPDVRVDTGVMTVICNHLSLETRDEDGNQFKMYLSPFAVMELMSTKPNMDKAYKMIFGKHHFKGKTSCLGYIYVPVVEDGHWWLFVILIDKKEIWIVDSVKSGRRQAGKKTRVKKMVGLLRSLFERYESGSWILQQLMDIKVEVDGSASTQDNPRDCGLFVAKQMMDQQEAPPFLVEVNEKTRNQIVSMLFFSFHNVTYDAVWERIDQAK